MTDGVSEQVTAEPQRPGDATIWQHVFEHSSRGIVVGLPDGTTLQLMNSAFARLFGSTVEELSGSPLMDVFEPSVHSNVAAMLELARRNEQHKFETLCRRKDGTTFPAVVEVTAVKEADGTVHYRVIRIEDVSLLKSRERALRDDRDEANRANTAKSLFVASLSHELRTPLNVILSFAQVMQFDDLSPIQAESVAHILQAGNHLLAVIDEALDISSVESGRITLTLEPVLVSGILNSVEELMQPLAETAGIRLVNESKRSALCAVADKHRLQQILLNLTTNAINYNVPDGEVRFRIRRQGGMVNISVIDTGLGIPPGRSHRVFVPFDRLGREAMNIEGTGLGLSLSKGLAEAMGGTIIAAPNAGPGTTFTLTLGASRSARGAGQSAVAPAVEEERGQVLFIVDSPASIELIGAIHDHRPGLRVLSAMQAGIGLELARYHHPDVIVLDAYLPDLTGEETRLRLSKDQRMNAIPVIMASAEARRRKHDVPLTEGDPAQRTKRIEISELLAAVDASLGAGEDRVPGGESPV